MSIAIDFNQLSEEDQERIVALYRDGLFSVEFNEERSSMAFVPNLEAMQKAGWKCVVITEKENASMNLRDNVSELIKTKVMNAPVYKLNDRGHIWWEISGKVIKEVAKYLKMDIYDGYEDQKKRGHSKSCRRREYDH